MIVYAVRETIPFESEDVIKLFSTLAKAKKFVKEMMEDEEYPFDLSIEKMKVE